MLRSPQGMATRVILRSIANGNGTAGAETKRSAGGLQKKGRRDHSSLRESIVSYVLLQKNERERYCATVGKSLASRRPQLDVCIARTDAIHGRRV